MLVMNGDTRLILGSVVFMLFLVIAIVIAIRAQYWWDKQERRRRALEILRRKAEIRARKEQEAADSALLDKIEEYHRDFDGYSG